MTAMNPFQVTDQKKVLSTFRQVVRINFDGSTSYSGLVQCPFVPDMVHLSFAIFPHTDGNVGGLTDSTTERKNASDNILTNVHNHMVGLSTNLSQGVCDGDVMVMNNFHNSVSTRLSTISFANTGRRSFNGYYQFIVFNMEPAGSYTPLSTAEGGFMVVLDFERYGTQPSRGG